MSNKDEQNVLSKKAVKQLEESIIDWMDSDNKMLNAQKQQDRAKKEISDVLKLYDLKQYTSNTMRKSVKVMIVKTRRMQYSVDKIKKHLDKETCNEIIDRTITIDDWDKLVSVMKEYNVPAKRIKNIITVQEKLNVDKLKEMYTTGDIDLNSLKGCYEISSTESLRKSLIEKKPFGNK